MLVNDEQPANALFLIAKVFSGIITSVTNSSFTYNFASLYKGLEEEL